MESSASYNGQKLLYNGAPVLQSPSVHLFPVFFCSSLAQICPFLLLQIHLLFFSIGSPLAQIQLAARPDSPISICASLPQTRRFLRLTWSRRSLTINSLVFRYEGGSFFHVVIFDTSRLEIEYPEDQRVNSDQPNVTNIKKEDGDDDSSVEIMAEWPSKTREEISVSSLSRLSKGDEEVLQGKGLAASSARDGVLQRARAFRSPNPHFNVIMKPAYDSHLDILESDATSHFHGRNDNEIYLMGPDAVAWPMKYSIGDPPLCQVRIISGWDKFSQTYRLLDGDACIFERLSCTLLAFNITIFRTDEEGEGNREITEEGAAGDGQLNREVPEGDGEEDNRKITEEGDGEGEVSDSADLQIAQPLQCGKPSFSVVFKFRSHGLYMLNIPSASLTYLSDQHNKQVFLHGLDGKTWTVMCYINGSHLRFSTGWKGFVVDNDLTEGDNCVFELQSQAPNHYNVTIIRVAQSVVPNPRMEYQKN